MEGGGKPTPTALKIKDKGESRDPLHRKKKVRRGPTPSHRPLKIRKYDNQKGETLSVHPDFPVTFPHFLWILSAPPRSGKTTLILNIIRETQLNFDYVYFVSRNATSDEKIARFELLPVKNRHNITKRLKLIEDVENLDQLPAHFETLFMPPVPDTDHKKDTEHRMVLVDEDEYREEKVDEPPPPPIKPNILLIWDDMSGDKDLASESSTLGKLIFSRRHMRLSIVLACHGLTRSPKYARINCDMLSFVNSNVSGDEIKLMQEEQTLVSKEALYRIFQEHNSKEYCITNIDRANNRITRGFNKPTAIG